MAEEHGLDYWRRIIIECLKKEGGVATPDRLLCAFHALKGLNKRRLMEIVENIPEIEVIREKYYPRADEEMIFLRLKGYEEKGGGASRGSDEDEVLRPRPRRCASCE